MHREFVLKSGQNDLSVMGEGIRDHGRFETVTPSENLPT